MIDWIIIIIYIYIIYIIIIYIYIISNLVWNFSIWLTI